MTELLTAPWRHEFVLSRDYRALGRHSELVADVRRGRLVPVIRGAFRLASARTNDRQRQPVDDYLAKVRATALLSRVPLQYSTLSAAVSWDLPFVSPWPTTVTISSPRQSGGRSNSILKRTSVGHPAPVELRNGLLVTSLSRTVVDVCRTCGFAEALAMADAALHGKKSADPDSARAPLTPEMLWAELSAVGTVPGSARCRGVLELASGASDSAGESLSRAGMCRLGLPAPVLQQPFFDRHGLVGVVDFWWPDYNLIGEFDGFGKYVREEFTHGRSIAEVVAREKEREDRLRALGPRVTRWGWATARSLPRLDAQLRSAGLC